MTWSVDTSRRRRSSSVAAAICVLGALVAPSRALATSTPVAQDEGDVVIVEVDDPSAERGFGGSAGQFALRLPDDASCPGDSASDQWRVQSFIVPASIDPATIVYGVIGPEGEDQHALYDVDTRPYTDAVTQPNTGPGQAGLLFAPPAMSFAVFPPATFPDGNYRLGIACTFDRKTDRYWDTEIVLTTEPSDSPAQLIWRRSDVSATDVRLPSDSGDSSNRWLWALAIGAGVTGVVLLLQTRGTRSRRVLKEQS